jgi:hypothetical protein
MDPDSNDYATLGYETDHSSLSSKVTEYIFENGTYPLIILPRAQADFPGRRYHSYFGTDKNLLPTDEVWINAFVGATDLS